MAYSMEEHIQDVYELLRAFQESPSSTHYLTTFLGEILGIVVRQQNQLQELSAAVETHHTRVMDELALMTSSFADVLKQTVERTALAINGIREEMVLMRRSASDQNMDHALGTHQSGGGTGYSVLAPRERLREMQIEKRIAELELLVETQLNPNVSNSAVKIPRGKPWETPYYPSEMNVPRDVGFTRFPSLVERSHSPPSTQAYEGVHEFTRNNGISTVARLEEEMDRLTERMRKMEITLEEHRVNAEKLAAQNDSLLRIFDIPKTLLYSSSTTNSSDSSALVNSPSSTPGYRGASAASVDVNEALTSISQGTTLRKVEFLHRLPCFHAILGHILRQTEK